MTTSTFRGVVVDWAGDVTLKEHLKLAVEQFTHSGRCSSHCKFVSEEFTDTSHMRRREIQYKAETYLDMAFFTF
jgi:hypothetical protein